jgi:transcriptional regulator with XRE-family HTH domain
MNKVKDIVRLARGRSTQAAFSKVLGKSQGLVSKYENGEISPPSEVIEECMDILNMNNSYDLSVSDLVLRIERELSGSNFIKARKAVEAILDSVSN